MSQGRHGLARMDVRLRCGVADTVGRGVRSSIEDTLGLRLAEIQVRRVFTIAGLSSQECALLLERCGLHDPVLQEAALAPHPSEADWMLEVGFRPGVTDNEGRTAAETARLVLGKKDGALHIYTARQYHLFAEHGQSLRREDVENIAKNLLANELIQRIEVKSRGEWASEPGFPARAAEVTGEPHREVAAIPLSGMSDAELLAFSRENTLAMNLEELRAVKGYFAKPETQALRREKGLPSEPTDAEIEVLAQTWSEHCKHKIFASRIEYKDAETGAEETINSLFKTYIQDSTAKIRAKLGESDFCRSVFKDNAGVMAFDDKHDICIKVETHNSPSALDPYGGALTGIVGVNRDPMGTGMGAELICNTDIFCFASPFYDKPLPPRILHPRRVLEGVRLGVEHGGNKSGVPTVNGSIVFEDRFLGKPLVFCGTVGLMPAWLRGKPGWQKQARPGDIIVMVGGRIGKDGIHGATFSSEELHEGSPATAVQIGDPITQRKAYDCIIKARDLGLYTAITDNGAGGLSSSVGEMAQDSGGCLLDLARAPLKYDGLRPWEILLSEAQERMTLAVPPENLAAFLTLAKEMDVEASALGEFTDSGLFHVMFDNVQVACLSMDFLHNGVPQMRLKAEWAPPKSSGASEPGIVAADVEGVSHSDFLPRLLGRLNICSKEYAIRQYDHEVKGGSVVKPLVGVKRDGPADAAVIRPVLESMAGLVLSHGICPKFSDYDTYWMVANAIDEAVRNAVAVGGDPTRMSGVDNFCWCDPVESEKTPDGRHKLAQLVRACKALADFCLAFGIPCISGKDSMKNDYTGGNVKISIPPTVLFSAMGVIGDVNRTVTSDLKAPGHLLDLLGETRPEMAGSEASHELGRPAYVGCGVPKVDAPSALKRYSTLHAAIQQGMVSACHDASDGGLSVAAAEMAIGGRLGLSLDISLAPKSLNPNLFELLYSESASRLLVTVAPEHAGAFEALFAGQICARIGKSLERADFVLNSGDTVLNLPVESLARAFKRTLDW